jgi:hypothetical protein
VPGVITLGTPKARVDLLLGPPLVGSTIYCLGWSSYAYADGTKILFAGGQVISVTPSGLAVGDPAHGFTVEHAGRQVYLEPMALCGVDIPGPLGDVKRHAEACFLFAPPNHAITGAAPLVPPPPVLAHPEPDPVPARKILGF